MENFQSKEQMVKNGMLPYVLPEQMYISELKHKHGLAGITQREGPDKMTLWAHFCVSQT